MYKNSFILGCRISDFRRLNGFTQKDLAGRVEVSVGFISKLECGLKLPTFETLYQIANALGVPIGWLFYDAASINDRSKTWLVSVAQLSRRRRIAKMREAAAVLDEICEKVEPINAFIQKWMPQNPKGTSFWKVMLVLQMAELIEKEQQSELSETEKSGDSMS
ncbi:MAG: helix-turn-helix transcriptional regulator [Bacillota bacterium]